MQINEYYHLYPKLKILMANMEYPPMHGGMGGYTENFAKSIILRGLEVEVVSDSNGAGKHHGLFSIQILVLLQRLVFRLFLSLITICDILDYD